MRGITSMAVVLGLLASVPGGRADEAAARGTVDKALQAHGGAAQLLKFPASQAKYKGTFQAMGMTLKFTADTAYQSGDQSRAAVQAEVDGQRFTFISVYNRGKAWEKINDDVEELDGERLAEAGEEAHAAWVATLVPLRDKAYTLAALGESKVENRAAVGVKVSHKGRRDVHLYFDKETGLLLKSETRVKDEEQGKEVTEEIYFSDYKEVQGVKQSMKQRVTRDGKQYLEGEVTELKLLEKLDDGIFGRP